MAHKHSSTERALKGAVIPSLGKSPIREIRSSGNKRTVVFDSGQKIVVSDAVLVAALHKNLALRQRNVALASIRVAKNGQAVEATIGGAKKGNVQKFKDRQSATEAIQKRYNKAEGTSPFGNNRPQSGDPAFQKMQRAFQLRQGGIIR